LYFKNYKQGDGVKLLVSVQQILRSRTFLLVEIMQKMHHRIV